MNEWQPIETAPKDGTIVLLWSRSSDEWATGLWQDVGLPQFFTPVAGMWVRNLYVAHDPTSNPYLPINDPTHWMPLPPPPEPK